MFKSLVFLRTCCQFSSEIFSTSPERLGGDRPRDPGRGVRGPPSGRRPDGLLGTRHARPGRPRGALPRRRRRPGRDRGPRGPLHQ